MAITNLAGLAIDIWEGGHGPPVLFLHGAGGFHVDGPFLDELGKHRRIIAPSHPGFGRSQLPDWMDRPDDIAHLYLDLLDRIGHAEIDVIGCSFGGWIAAELATMVPHRIRSMVLVAPCGVKLGDREALDIPDIYAMPADAVEKLLYHRPERHRRVLADMSDDELAIMLRNREAFALFGWEPYLHNPKLPHRLHRAICPTLFIRGEFDGLIAADYIKGYADLFPDARILTIPDAGHLPQVEQPEAFVAAAVAFIRGEM